jgi:hypothetical protein
MGVNAAKQMNRQREMTEAEPNQRSRARRGKASKRKAAITQQPVSRTIIPEELI